VNGYSGVYDGNAHGATGSATGVKGESLTSLLHFGLDLHQTCPAAPPAGPLTAIPTTNPPGGTVSIAIHAGECEHHCERLQPASTTAMRMAPTGSATGVRGESLNSLVHLGLTFTNVPGGTASLDL